MTTQELVDIREAELIKDGETVDEGPEANLTDCLYRLEAATTLLMAMANPRVVRKFTDKDRDRCNRLARDNRTFLETFDY